MPDIFQTITSGFYDSVNKDRLYTADQMNMPYKKLVKDGVYEESGTGAAFSVTAAGGMKVTVAPGNAMIGGKWAENEDALTVEISGNTSESARVDSIILRLDANTETRAAGIVYRQGETAAPALDTSAGVKEFRLANITVAVNAASITDANITDTRGGADCPWVRSVIAPSQTEVPDGSITAAKFTSALRAETIKDYVTPQIYPGRLLYHEYRRSIEKQYYHYGRPVRGDGDLSYKRHERNAAFYIQRISTERPHTHL